MLVFSDRLTRTYTGAQRPRRFLAEVALEGSVVSVCFRFRAAEGGFFDKRVVGGGSRGGGGGLTLNA